MNLNDSNRIRHYEEADRLVRLADEKARLLDKVSKADAYMRADLEQEMDAAVQRAHVHALLAGIDLPERTEQSIGLE